MMMGMSAVLPLASRTAWDVIFSMVPLTWAQENMKVTPTRVMNMLTGQFAWTSLRGMCNMPTPRAKAAATPRMPTLRSRKQDRVTIAATTMRDTIAGAVMAVSNGR